MRKRALVAVLSSLTFACSSAEVPPPPAPTPDAETPLGDSPTDKPDTSGEPKHACGDAAACYAAGKSAREAKDLEKARPLFQAACDQGNGEGCSELASIVQSLDKDSATAEKLWLKGCDLGDAGSCFNAAEQIRERKPKEATPLYAKACKGAGEKAMLVGLACGRGGVHAYESGDAAAAADMALASCTDTRSSGCNLLGVLHLEGKGGVKQDKDKAAELFKKACAAGDKSACENEKKVAGGLDVPGANIKMGSVTADGFTLNDMQCNAQGAGLGALLLGPAVAGALGKKKGALDACAPKGADVRVRWTAAGGKITAAEAKSSDPKIEACVAKVLKTVPAVLEGTCAASMHIGKK